MLLKFSTLKINIATMNDFEDEELYQELISEISQNEINQAKLLANDRINDLSD